MPKKPKQIICLHTKSRNVSGVHLT